MNYNQKSSETVPLSLSGRSRSRRAALTALLVALLLTTNLTGTLGLSLADDGLAVSTAARVANTDGDPLRMRDNPSASADTITMIDANEVVTIKSGIVKDKAGNAFYKVSYKDKTGYAMAEYLISAGKATKSIPTVTVGSPAKIINTDGDGANLRQQATAGAPVLAVLGENSIVTVMGGPFTDKQNNSFYRVDYQGQTGYVTIAFVSAAPKNTVASGGGAMLKVTNTDGDPIRLRSGPGRTFDNAGLLYEGQVVKELSSAVKDDAGVKWYRVEQGGNVGFVDATYLIRTNGQTAPAPAPAPAKNVAPAPAKTAAPAPAPTPKPKAPVLVPPPSNGTLGSKIVSYAKQFLGWRYVWGGHSPEAGGFDCSGLVHWVLSQNGISSGYSSADDLNIGKPVPLTALEPGDILVWSNTYMPGPSHSGIYIGGGMFIHAENYSSGVTITSMSSPYYASRLTAARRP